MSGDERIRIGAAIRELRRAVQQVREQIQGPLDLGQSDALEAIVSAGSCRMSQLAESLRVDASTTTRAVDRLVAAGLVRRIDDPADGRAVRVAATAAGRAARARVRERAKRVMDEVLVDFTAAEKKALADFLERLVSGFDHVTEQGIRGQSTS